MLDFAKWSASGCDDAGWQCHACGAQDNHYDRCRVCKQPGWLADMENPLYPHPRIQMERDRESGIRCTDCGRPMREVRHENGRCAECY